MTTSTLSTVTLQSLENYRQAASQAVVAYQLGGHRLVRAVNGALTNTVYPRTARLAPRATVHMDAVRGNVSDLVVKGIDQVAQRASAAIEMGSQAAASQLTQVAQLAAGIDNEYVVGGLNVAARASLPGAQLALVVSSRVAEGAKALADAAAQRQTAPAVVKKAATRAKRRVKAQGKAPLAKAQRSLRSTGKTVKKAVKRAAAA